MCLYLSLPAAFTPKHLSCFDTMQIVIQCHRLQDAAPKEASVWFQIGKIYKRLERPQEAMRHFCVALDLKPPSSDVNLIKSAIEKLRVSDDAAEVEI